MKKWKELLPLVIILLVMAFLLLSARSPSVSVASPESSLALHSSYSTVPEGYKALFLTLNELGYQAKQQTRPFDLLEGKGLLIIADPYKVPISELDARSLFDWVREGNRVLFLVEEHPESVMALTSNEDSPEREMIFRDEDVRWMERVYDKEQGEYSNEQSVPYDKAAFVAAATKDSSLGATAPALSIKTNYRISKNEVLPEKLLDLLKKSPTPLYADNKGTALMSSEVGQGKIYWCTSPWSFSNEGIKEESNLDFVLALAGDKKGGVVLFDEYHHGFGRNISILTLLPRLTNIGLLQLVLALLLLGLTLAWRFGPPRLPDAERFTRSRAEYLTSMAGLLERAQATHVVRDRLDTLLRRRLCRRLGINTTASAEQILHTNANLLLVNQRDLDRVLAQLQMLAAQPRPEMPALLNLAHEIHSLLHAKQS